jgi:peptidoglycan/xylan/chitin deacetylase (PgdA/CDA1 family)
MRVDTTTAAATSAVPVAPHRAPLIYKASIACHLGAGVAAAALPLEWPWAVGVVALNHVVLTATGLWPRSTWLGPNMLRLPAEAAQRDEIAITLDDGPDPAVTPAVLDILDAHGARATFFCIAERARAHPQLCREIVRRGHSVQNHSLRHSHSFSLLGPGGFTREIGDAQRMLVEITGVAPRFFRAPAGVRNPLLGPVLRRLGLDLVTWTRRGYDTVQRRPERVLARLTTRLAAGDILVLHDGNAARAADGRPVVLGALQGLLENIERRQLRAVTLTHAVGAEATS